jgi:hypothetical protein
MRIIIETDDRSSPQLELRSAEHSTKAAPQAEATDAGPPSAELVSAINPGESRAQEPERRSSSNKQASTRDNDGGAAPSWLTALTEGVEVR